MLNNKYKVASSFLASQFAQDALEHISYTYGNALPFQEAVCDILDIFPSIDRGELAHEWTPFLGLYYFGNNLDEELTIADLLDQLDDEGETAFGYETTGEFYKAFKAGVEAGSKHIQPDFHFEESSVDYRTALGEIYLAITIPHEDSRVTPLEALARSVYQEYDKIFGGYDSGRFDGYRRSEADACRAFWTHFGFSINDIGRPMTWW